MDQNGDTPENSGGEGGGRVLILKRSELAILRRYANRYPIVDGERQEAVDVAMEHIRDKDIGPRNRIAAMKALIAMDKLNLDEVATYLNAKHDAKEELKPASAVTINNHTQVNVYGDPSELRKLSAEQLAELHRQTLSLPEPHKNGTGRAG